MRLERCDLPYLMSARPPLMGKSLFLIIVINGFLSVVRTERLELSHLAALEPKSSASTNSATFAKLP